MDDNRIIKKIIFDQKQIKTKTKQMAEEITNFYKSIKDLKNKSIILLGLLDGCVPFFAEFMKNFNLPCQTVFLKASSYKGGKTTTGFVDIKYMNDDVDYKDKYILILEDILDSGITLEQVTQEIKSKGAKDVKVATLMDKKEGRVNSFKADWFGFEAPNEFLIGYGLDYKGFFRNLPYVAVMNDEIDIDWS